LNTKTIFVTGATDGIGEKTALELARQGHTLLLHGRDKEKGARVLEKINKETCNGNLSFYLADYSSLKEVKEMVEAVQREHKRLDVLVNNAGGFFRERQINADGLEMSITVNHLAPVLLTMLLLDTIMAGAPSRIVTVASTATAIFIPLILKTCMARRPIRVLMPTRSLSWATSSFQTRWRVG